MIMRMRMDVSGQCWALVEGQRARLRREDRDGGDGSDCLGGGEDGAHSGIKLTWLSRRECGDEFMPDGLCGGVLLLGRGGVRCRGGAGSEVGTEPGAGRTPPSTGAHGVNDRESTPETVSQADRPDASACRSLGEGGAATAAGGRGQSEVEMMLARAMWRRKGSCWVCGRVAEQECAMCVKAQYCGRECQFSHWTKHRNTCRLLRPRDKKTGPMPPRADWHKIMTRCHAPPCPPHALPLESDVCACLSAFFVVVCECSCERGTAETFIEQSSAKSPWALDWVPPGKEHLAHYSRRGVGRSAYAPSRSGSSPLRPGWDAARGGRGRGRGSTGYRGRGGAEAGEGQLRSRSPTARSWSPDGGLGFPRAARDGRPRGRGGRGWSGQSAGLDTGHLPAGDAGAAAQGAG